MKKCYRWDEKFSTEETNDVAIKIASHLLTRLPASTERDDLQRLLAGRDYRGLVGFDFHCGPPLSVSSALTIRQILALFQKREDLDLGIDRADVALQAFLDSEKRCRVTNEAFRSWGLGRFRFPPDVDGVFHTAMRQISRILGDVPTLDELRMRFGPGSTIGLPKNKANALRKLRSPFACSEELAPYVTNVLEQVPSWAFRGDPEADVVTVDVTISDGRLSFVRKNAKTDRSIVTEPLLNTFVQLGIGDHMARRLKHFGQDITDQTRNQRLAREGSLTDGLATIDLSSASDSISIELVRHLVPWDWVQLLEKARTGTIETPLGILKLEKFSSMGNGFTFPLETLIFLSLCRAVAAHVNLPQAEIEKISVYGDDITMPSAGVPLLLKTLRCAGFVVNTSKSYTSGNFRESCGADYYYGINIRPVYLRKEFDGESLFVMHNFFRREHDDEVADLILEYIDANLRIFGPDGYGDGHLISRDPPLTPVRKNGYGGYTFETYTWKTRKFQTFLLPGDGVFPLYSIYLSEGVDDRSTISPTCSYSSNGAVRTVLPGRKGYRRIKIYTLTP